MRKIFLTAALAVTLVACGCSATAGMKARSAERKADRALASRDYEAAAARYLEAHETRPRAHLMLKRAWCLRQIGRTAESRTALEESQKLGDDHAALLLAVENGAPSSQLAPLAAKADGDPYAHAVLGEALAREGHWAGAADAFDEASKRAGNLDAFKAEVLYNLTVASLRARRYSNAAQAFRKYESACGAALDNDERYLKAVVLYAAGDREGAVAAWAALDESARSAIASELGNEAALLAAVND